MALWNPATYLQYVDERARPFYDLLSQVRSAQPQTVVDLGCGPGQLTATLATRWPQALVHGIDQSTAMVAEAARHAGPRVTFAVGDLRDWAPERPVDVVVSNATLQWVPGHLGLLPRLVQSLSADGWLAFQVPGNFDEPSHQILRGLAADDRFSSYTTGLEVPAAFDADTYLAELSRLGCRVDAWETTYLHVLSGPDPVFRWIAGTGARPILQALPASQRAEFETDYRALLREAYAEQAYGTLLPFRRVFVVAQRR